MILAAKVGSRRYCLGRGTIYSVRLNRTETPIVGIPARFNHTETDFGKNQTENVFGKNHAETVFGTNLPPAGGCRVNLRSCGFFYHPLE